MQKRALATIMELASTTKRQLLEEMNQRADAIEKLRIMSGEETT